MYKEIENILVRTLSPFEYEKIEKLKDNYTEQQIIDAYKNSKVKNVNYIAKTLESYKKVMPEPNWLNFEIEAEPIDEETQQLIDNFNKFIEEFRNDTNNNI